MKTREQSPDQIPPRPKRIRAGDIYADCEQMLGIVPFILQVITRHLEFMIFSALKDFYALRPQSLDAKTAGLLAVSAAAASGAVHKKNAPDDKQNKW